MGESNLALVTAWERDFKESSGILLFLEVIKMTLHAERCSEVLNIK